MDSRHYDIEVGLLRLRERRRRRRNLRNRLLFLFLLWVLVFQLFGIARVKGDSMNPAYHEKDVVLYLRILPKELSYGEVILFQNPSGEPCIKRIAGLPGDTLTWDTQGHLTRNGQAVIEREMIYGPTGGLEETGTEETVPASATVEEGAYFYLGDNRPVSLDSRSEKMGCVRREEIKGVVLAAYRLQ